MLMTIEVAIRTIEPMRTISGLIFTPLVCSLKNVRRPALEAGIGPFLLSLIEVQRMSIPFLSIAPCESYNYRSRFALHNARDQL